MIVHRDYSIPKPSQINVRPQSLGPLRQSRPRSCPPPCEAEAWSGWHIPARSANSAICEIGPCAMCFLASAPWSAPARADRCARTGRAAGRRGHLCLSARTGQFCRRTIQAGGVRRIRDRRAATRAPSAPTSSICLPFASMPQALTHISSSVAGWDELEAKVPLHDAGTFVFENRTGDLWSFAPAAAGEHPVRPGGSKNQPRRFRSKKSKRDPVLRAQIFMAHAEAF